MTVSRLVITSDSAELALVRSWLRERLGEQGFSVEEQSRLQIAVTELAANAIEHSYESMAGQPIYITIEPSDDRVVIQIEDLGTPFDPARYRAPDLEVPAEGGLGLYIAGRLADELSVDLARDHGTRWTLVKYRKHREGYRSPEGQRWTSK